MYDYNYHSDCRIYHHRDYLIIYYRRDYPNNFNKYNHIFDHPNNLCIYHDCSNNLHVDFNFDNLRIDIDHFIEYPNNICIYHYSNNFDNNLFFLLFDKLFFKHWAVNI